MTAGSRAWARGADAETFAAEHAVFLEAMRDDELLDRPCGGRTADRSVLVFGIAITLPCACRVLAKGNDARSRIEQMLQPRSETGRPLPCPESLSGSRALSVRLCRNCRDRSERAGRPPVPAEIDHRPDGDVDILQTLRAR